MFFAEVSLNRFLTRVLLSALSAQPVVIQNIFHAHDGNGAVESSNLPLERLPKLIGSELGTKGTCLLDSRPDYFWLLNRAVHR